MQMGWAHSILKSIPPRPTQMKGLQKLLQVVHLVWQIKWAETSLNTWIKRKNETANLSLWTQAIQMTRSAFCFVDLLPHLLLFSFTSLWQHTDKRIKGNTDRRAVQKLKLLRKKVGFLPFCSWKIFKEKSFFYLMNEIKNHGLNADSLEEMWRLGTRKIWQGQILHRLLHQDISGQEYFTQPVLKNSEAACRSQ